MYVIVPIGRCTISRQRERIVRRIDRTELQWPTGQSCNDRVAIRRPGGGGPSRRLIVAAHRSVVWDPYNSYIVGKLSSRRIGLYHYPIRAYYIIYIIILMVGSWCFVKELWYFEMQFQIRWLPFCCWRLIIDNHHMNRSYEFNWVAPPHLKWFSVWQLFTGIVHIPRRLKVLVMCKLTEVTGTSGKRKTNTNKHNTRGLKYRTTRRRQKMPLEVEFRKIYWNIQMTEVFICAVVVLHLEVLFRGVGWGGRGGGGGYWWGGEGGYWWGGEGGYWWGPPGPPSTPPRGGGNFTLCMCVSSKCNF